jgi:hypothetical protein
VRRVLRVVLIGVEGDSRVGCCVGGLPETVEAFNNVIKAQKDMGKLIKTVTDREGKLDDAEWTNSGIFVRYELLFSRLETLLS